MIPLTVRIKEEWWNPTQRQVVTEEAAGTDLIPLGAKETDVPNEVTAEELDILYTVTLAPLNFPILSSRPLS